MKIFDNRTDTNALIQNSDIFISTLSAVLFQAIMKGKPVIFYDKWRKAKSMPVSTIFDHSECVLTASSREELAASVKKTMVKSSLDHKIADEFYRGSVSAGVPVGGSIVKKYLEEIIDAVE